MKRPNAPTGARAGKTAKPAGRRPQPTAPVAPVAPTSSTASGLARQQSGATKQSLKREQQRLSRLRSSRSKPQSETALFLAYRKHRRTVILVIATPLVLLLGLVIATLTTPMLAIEKISVKGTDRLEKSQILNALEGQIGTPLTLVDSNTVGEALKTFVLVESYAVIAKPPHELVVRITERQPICMVEVNGVAYLYDPAGVRIGVAKASDDLPLVHIHGEPKTSSHYKSAIDVLLALPAELLPRVQTVEARTKDDVRMQLRGSARQQIVWGDSSNSVLKSKVLRALLRHVRESQSATIDVSSPTAPVVRYGNF